MIKTLHVIKSIGNHHPWDILSKPPLRDHSASVILIQDAVAARADTLFPTFVLAPDAAKRGVKPPYPLIDDDQLLAMILEADTVMVW